jgi:hypothetical protein
VLRGTVDENTVGATIGTPFPSVSKLIETAAQFETAITMNHDAPRAAKYRFPILPAR